MEKTILAETTIFSAKAPNPLKNPTLSPALKPVTPSPTEDIIPEPSCPGEKGLYV
jgi:hypothetical protein